MIKEEQAEVLSDEDTIKAFERDEASIREFQDTKRVSNTLEVYATAKHSKIKKVFLGKIDNFKSKEERAFEKKHLAAYLAGKKRFKYGKDELGQPSYYDVLYKFIEIA